MQGRWLKLCLLAAAGIRIRGGQQLRRRLVVATSFTMAAIMMHTHQW